LKNYYLWKNNDSLSIIIKEDIIYNCST